MLFAQTFTGTWQGALKIPQAPNGELRIVIKISTTDKDTLQAEMYSIDQGGQPIKAESSKAEAARPSKLGFRQLMAPMKAA